MLTNKLNVVSAAVPTATNQEAELIAVLKSSDASLKDKWDACRNLALVGTDEAIETLAGMLGEDERVSHYARYALEPIPSPKVDQALRDALGKVKGTPLVGVIGSIGVRRDAKAVDSLVKFLSDNNPQVAQAAARALGSIGTGDGACLVGPFAMVRDAHSRGSISRRQTTEAGGGDVAGTGRELSCNWVATGFDSSSRERSRLR
mgnify:CR=1 FL=1